MDYVTGARYLSELYLATDPGFAGRFTIPCLWDTHSHRIVTSDVSLVHLPYGGQYHGRQ